MYKSFKTLLLFDEEKEQMSVEEAFGLTFQVAITDAMGSKLTYDLKENGETIVVTKDNRKVRQYNDKAKNIFVVIF